MTPLFRRAVAEAIGTFFLCFTGVMVICQNEMARTSEVAALKGPGLLGIAVAHGLALAIAISALGKVSGGHFNPAVTATMLVTRQMRLVESIVYIVAQLIGGVLAG